VFICSYVSGAVPAADTYMTSTQPPSQVYHNGSSIPPQQHMM